MVDEKIYAVDRIPDLPEFILYHILSLLSRKELAKTGLFVQEMELRMVHIPHFRF